MVEDGSKKLSDMVIFTIFISLFLVLILAYIPTINQATTEVAIERQGGLTPGSHIYRIYDILTTHYIIELLFVALLIIVLVVLLVRRIKK